jgi:Epoxide hydrolase N terminus
LRTPALPLAKEKCIVRRRDLLRLGAATCGLSVWPQLCASAFGQQASASNSKPETFRIAFTKDQIADLHRRIDATMWPEVPYETGWTTGTDDRVLRDLAKYWRNDYDWFRTEERLNKLPHHRLAIEGEKIHFVWYRGSGARQRFPLLLLHGWPSTFLEFEAAAPLLTAGSEGRPGFDLIVPSLPGFVFSDAPRARACIPAALLTGCTS